MLFNTISEYDEELDEIKSILDSMEQRLDEEPLSFARKGNYRTLKEIYLNGARIPGLLQVEDELHKKSISYQMLLVILYMLSVDILYFVFKINWNIK